MGVWGWIVLYVLLFALLQLLIYRYLRSDEDAPLFRSTPPNRETTPVEETPIEEVREFEERRRSDDSSVTVCPRCGVENDTGYTYCRNCVSPMSAR
jgi:ribosomal protein L40E